MVNCRAPFLLEVVPLPGSRLRYPGRRPSRPHRRRQGRAIRGVAGCVGGGCVREHGRRGRVRHRSIGMVSGERRLVS